MKPLVSFPPFAFAMSVLLSSIQSAGAAEQTGAPVVPPPAPAAPAAAKPAKKPRTPEDALTPAIKDPHRHEQFLKRIKEGEVGLLFLGDSITDAWPRSGKASWEKFAPYKPADFGISGDRTEHVIWRITNGELEGIDPKVTVIMIGTNNIGHFSDEKPEWAAAGVKKIVDIVHEKLPRTKVLLLGVFPRGTPDSPQRKAVDSINTIISTYDNGKDTKYLDVSKSFLDDNGNIPADVMPDKLHPNAKGYEIWYEAMWPVLQDMLK